MQKYTFVKDLDQGSFGSVKLIKGIDDGNLFALKEINLLNLESVDNEKTKVEVDILRRLNHPNIIKYVEHFEDKGKLSIVMEYADGGNLDTLIRESSKSTLSQGPGSSNLSEEEIMRYFCQVCSALGYLHSNHIIHRDLKALNVFLSSYGIVKLGDFGTSKILECTAAIAKTQCGTCHYFSPELCRGKDYNHKSDVWALGVLLYYLAMAKYPFDANNELAIVQRIDEGTYEPLPKATNNNNGFSNEFTSLVDHLLDYNAVTRYDIKQVLSTPIVQAALKKNEKRG